LRQTLAPDTAGNLRLIADQPGLLLKRHGATGGHVPDSRLLRTRGRSDPYDGAMDYERITIDPAKMRGVPCIRGLRIPVATVLGQLAAGRTADEILDEFPDLEAADIPAALKYAAAAVQERELPLTRPA
jgi:uncharacterized protein (DUF433 family)